MANTKLHSPWPYFLLAALGGLVPVLNNRYPAAFFPAVAPGLVELFSVAGGIFAAAMAFARLWARLLQRDRARSLVQEAVGKRVPEGKQDPAEASNAGRLVSRLVRNADEDLREIHPDFSLVSLKRLQDYLPRLLEEVEGEEDALIRLGVVGVYLGETLCRNSGWRWFFKNDPGLKRFGFLSSVLRKGDREIDPFARAAEALTGHRRLTETLKEKT